MHRHVVAPVETARGLLQEECDQVAAEKRAFGRFEDRLADIDPEAFRISRGVNAPAARTVVRPAGGGGSDPLATVREAYRATVMAVDHFEAVYDETLGEHVASELGRDIAVGVIGGDSSGFTASFKGTLVGAVREARTSRGRLLDSFERERTSLDTAHRDLRDIVDGTSDLTDSLGRSRTTGNGRPTGDGRPTGETGDIEERRYTGMRRASRAEQPDVDIPPCLADLRERCESVAADRQAALARRVTDGNTLDGHALCEYLYQEADWTYPVLTATTTLAADLDAVGRHLDSDG